MSDFKFDFNFDPIGEFQKTWRAGSNAAKVGQKLGRTWAANRQRAAVEAEFGTEVADAVVAAIKAGQDPAPILERARRAKAEKAERDAMLASPPPLHGSATWARTDELTKVLRPREAFDNPSSVLLGAYEDESDPLMPVQFAHWDGDGHLLTVAPTRSGKALTTIIPNLLRYRGSVVVIDPKGELYASTSKWRRENVGPVYRLAPFDDGSAHGKAGWLRHGYNPLTRVKTQSDARSMAELLFPRDPKSPEFFSDDVVAFMTAVIRFVLDEAPPDRRTLVTVRQITAQPLDKFKQTIERMTRSRLASVAEAAHNVLGKSGDRGLPNLRDTLNSKLALWSDDALQDNLRRHDFDFEGLKNGPATVYLEIPFDLMKPYAPWLRVVLKSALDAMIRNQASPEIPVLFVLDEFLALGPFPEFRDAIRTHAGAGVRLWFFLQDVASLEEHYPGATWRPFLNCSVKQFFGVDDPFTGELIGKYLGTATVAYKATNAGSNVSAQSAGGGWMDDGGSSGVTFSSGESVQFVGRPLLTPDEVMALLSDWQGDGWRWGILHMRGPRPFKVRLAVHQKSPSCAGRLGAHVEGV